MLPSTILVILFEGAPKHFAYTTDDAREYLNDVFEDAGELYHVFEVHNDTSVEADITLPFADGWAQDIDFGAGDEASEFLKHFPGFVVAHCREALVATYRAAQGERAHG